MSDGVNEYKESKLMTEEENNQLYLYSLKKLAEENVDNQRIKMTNLMNNKAFFFKANEFVNENQDKNIAVIKMDIYRFRTVNEFCGRKTGDELLKFIADCFRKYERKDCIVAHFRADIFAMCLSYKDKQELIDIVNDINDQIQQYDITCKLIPSFGIYVSKHHMIDVSLMCDYADLAMQKIKGKTYVLYEFYDEKMREVLLHEKKIENDVSAALKGREFMVYIQPKVDMRDRSIVGGEALVRWYSKKENRFIYPDMFIPVLEKSGYIMEVDAFVWEEVFKTIRVWIDAGIEPVPISINVSRSHVYQDSFADFLCELSKKYEVPSKYIVLEITESMFTEYEDKLYSNITYLQEYGFQFSMDDFGAGYSSLNMLKDEPVDEVKIDRMFLKDIDDKKSKIVIRNVVNMLHELEIDMIVEGIETEEQAKLLMEYGCYRAQGYYYYKPMPVEDFTKLLEKR